MRCFKSFRFSALILLMSCFLFTCGKDNSTEPEEEEHADVIGVVVKEGDTEVARYQSLIVSGEIQVPLGDESPALSVYFISPGGSLMRPEGDQYSMSLTVGSTNVAVAKQHINDNKWDFYVLGKKEGGTTVQIRLMNDDDIDYVAQPLPIKVAQSL
ncbi:hypothetical protein BVY01_04665 [bacterium I07]|nr:hypothetical protein BVY01_04665 [bacterium I07]